MDTGPIAPTAAARATLTAAQWRVIVLASLGGGLEFYDFIIYGIFAPSIAAAFFPLANPTMSLVLSFAVFAGGYVTRPLGGMLLGALGDRIGRRDVFLWSILVVSACTTLMGLLPGYAVWGTAASLLMIALRLLQGFCLGGELPCAIVYVVETAPRRAGFACGVLFCCVNSGVGLATLVSLLLHGIFSAADMAAFGWRLAFLLGGVTGLGSFLLRRALRESPEFLAMRATASATPLGDLLAGHRGGVLVGIGVVAATAAFNGLLFAYMPAYLTRVLAYPPPLAATAQNVALAVMSAALLGIAWLGDILSRRLLLAIGAMLLVVFSHGFFAALAAGDGDLMALFVLAALAGAFCNGVFACILADLFPTRVRFSGVATAYNIGMTLFGGSMPLLASALVASTGLATAPGFLIAGFSGLTLLAGLVLTRFSGHITGVRASETISNTETGM